MNTQINSGILPKPKHPIQPEFNESKDTTKLEQRKEHLNEYRDLFTALFKIKDKYVRKRVMLAINGSGISCENCGHNQLDWTIKQNGVAQKATITTPSNPHLNKITVHQNGKYPRFSCGTQTVQSDFELLNTVNKIDNNNMIKIKHNQAALLPPLKIDKLTTIRVHKIKQPYAANNNNDKIMHKTTTTNTKKITKIANTSVSEKVCEYFEIFPLYCRFLCIINFYNIQVGLLLKLDN